METDNLLDVFDYDLDIDFETAYEMVNNDDQLDKMHLNHNASTIDAAVDQWSPSEHGGLKRELNDATDNGSLTLAGLEHTAMPGLLSAFESSAIEKFLDSLVTTSGKAAASWSGLPNPAWAKNGEHDHHVRKHLSHLDDLESPKRLGSFALNTVPPISLSQSNDVSTNQCGSKEVILGEHPSAELNQVAHETVTDIHPKESVSSSSVYAPEVLKSPEILVLDSEIPLEIRNDPTKRRKWRHVALEKKRRNAIKEYFDDLVELIHFPRSVPSEMEDVEDGKPKGSKKRSKKDRPADKRIPKHVLLNYLIEDMNSVLQANQKLEEQLKSFRESQSV
ncbi:Ino2p LALA0_S07e05842g [Lachancea lanzarotensis]|uniref:LALA0S07e05842g1_1 n=1 Tax=Lachancea lanzarotensis TaxID=1245769 RepID=A0A0C7NCB0_9SACH|nr:uncharacterized protein LALA0_S07e05842g [Lachancea lanzarotensis]CEP63249.1 LALA0S07e05842g1_1 [Lachancea lanzarotensis]